MLIRHCAVDSMVEYKLVIDIYEQIVIIHKAPLAQAPGIEADPVVLPCQIKLRIRINLVAHKGIPGSEQQPFPVFHSAH